MINSELFSALIGFGMPYIVEMIKSKLPKTKGKWLGYVLAYGVSVLVGGATASFEGNFNAENILSSAGSALIVSQGVYNLYFKPKKVDETINRMFKN